MTEWMRFGDPATLQLGIRWVEDTEPPDRRPAAYGWSMGQLTMHVANVNITATKLGQDDQPHVGWYLAPLLDWLATNWAALLHEERLPWPNPGWAPAALACNRALDEWMGASDPQGAQHYANAQDWYFRHGMRNAAAGGIFPDVFIRRIADDIEISWSGRPAEFTQDGLAFESGAGYARLPVRDVAEAMWRMIEWAASHPPKSPSRYHDQIAMFRTKVDSLRGIEQTVLACAHVAPAVLERVRSAFVGREGLLGSQAANDAPYIVELSPAVAMFGGVSPDLSPRDVQYLRDQIIAAQGGGDSPELANLVADRQYNPLGVPYQDGYRFADELLEDVAMPDNNFVDVQAMCSRLGIDIHETTLETDSIRGIAVAGDGFSPRIAINRTHHFNSNDSGKRFTIAHELCHVLFDRTRARRVAHASSGPWAAPGIEQRANAFAAYLLMPRTLVLEHLPDANRIERSDIQRLARSLKVNESALLRHLRNLGFIDTGESERLLDGLARDGSLPGSVAGKPGKPE